MKAVIVQDIEAEVGGYVCRRQVVGAITRCRQRIEEELGGGILMPPQLSELLADICRSLEFTQFEMVEAMGSVWAVQEMWNALLPDFPSAQAEVEWVENQKSYQPRKVQL